MTGQTAAAFFESARFFVRLCASDAAAFAPSTALRCPVTRFVSGFGFSASDTGFAFFVRAVLPFRRFVSGFGFFRFGYRFRASVCVVFSLRHFVSGGSGFFRFLLCLIGSVLLPGRLFVLKTKIPRTPCDGRTGKPMRIRVVFVPKDKILYRQVYVFFYYTPIFLVCQLKNQIIW